MRVDQEVNGVHTNPYLQTMSPNLGEYRMRMETSPHKGANMKWTASGRHQGVGNNERQHQEQTLGRLTAVEYATRKRIISEILNHKDHLQEDQMGGKTRWHPQAG